MNKILSIAVCIYLATHLIACTESAPEAENGEQPAAMALENPENGGQAADDKAAPKVDEAQAGFLDESLPNDAQGTPTTDAAAAPADNGATVAKTDDSSPFSLDEPAATPAPTADAAAPEPAVAGGGLDLGGDKKEEVAEAPAPVKPMAALQKVKDSPFHEGGQLLNAVYISRPGDNYKKISTMIYGDQSKAADLQAANPGMKKVKPGQKVYYNSPKRTTDESKLMNYYEEAGMPAETYVAKDGDDLKKVSKGLVGYPEGWKEIWATNSVESKGAIPAGTELKYWKGAAVAAVSPAPPMDAGTPPPAVPAPVPEAPAAQVPPPPAAQMAPPPPPMPEANMPPPPPPPGPEANMPPPPPPPMPEANTPNPQMPNQAANMVNARNKVKAPAAPAEEGFDQDTLMMLGGAVVVALGLAAVIMIRKRKAQKAAAAGYEAQVS